MTDQLLTKYKVYRKIAKDGDIILTHSTKFIAESIQWVDNAHWHHCELVHWTHGRLMGFGAHPEGTFADFLSLRIKKKGWDDFMIIRPTAEAHKITEAFYKLYARSEEFNQYDYSMIFHLLLKKFNINNKLGKENKNICSELVQQFMAYLGDDLNIVTPQDVIRYLNDNYNILIIEF